MMDSYKEKLINYINDDVDQYGENSEEYRKKCIVHRNGNIFFKQYYLNRNGEKKYYKDCEINDLKYFCSLLRDYGEY